jgi:nucleotide-binding universal stress UspA family protein
MFKSILLAVDGSVYTTPVLQYGILLAKKLKAHLRVLTVLDVRVFEWAVAVGVEGFAPIIPSSSYQEESQALLEQKADEILKKTEKMLNTHKIQYTLEKESGNPVDIICNKGRLVDLMVLGARGEFARWSEKMLGATLEALSRLCIKPILVVPKEYSDITKILVSYDGSENATKALTLTAYLASTMKLPITILNVNGSRENGQEILKEAREYFEPYGIKDLQEKTADGEVPEKIVEAAGDVKADLIIMGSYGHSRIREAILGSNTVQVMRKSPVPVLIAR